MRPLVDGVRAALRGLPRDRRVGRRRPADARGAPRAARPARHRRHRPDAPGRRGRHAGRRDLRPVRSGALRAARPRTTASCASTCRAARATASGCRRSAASATPRTACRSDAGRRASSRRRSTSLAATGRPASARAPAAHDRRDRCPDRRGGATRAVDLARLPRRRDQEERAAASAQRLDQEPAARARRRRAVARAASPYRGDSLWWFTELYLHKQQVDPRALPHASPRSTRCSTREQPRGDRASSSGRSRWSGRITAQFAAAHGVALRRTPRPRAAGAGRARRAWTRAARCAARPPRSRRGCGRRQPRGRRRAARRRLRAPRVLAAGGGRRQRRVVHRSGAAGARAAAAAGGRALRRRRPVGELPRPALVASAGRRPASGQRAAVERVRAARRRCGVARRCGGSGTRCAARCGSSDDLRAAARDPRLRLLAASSASELAGVALLQWPWSARAMDEAGAALDALAAGSRASPTPKPAAGAARSCSKRAAAASRSVGLQHGFIYRHWLNYLHEPDEMQPTRRIRPTPVSRARSLTLVFDGYAARHLRRRGPLPARRAARHRQPAARRAGRSATRRLSRGRHRAARARRRAPARRTRWCSSRPSSGGASACCRRCSTAAGGAARRARSSIKTHPAETPDAYARRSRGQPHVRVLPAAAPLAPLLRGQPRRRDDELDGGARRGRARRPGAGHRPAEQPVARSSRPASWPARRPARSRPALRAVLYDEEFRQQLEARAAGVPARDSRCASDGDAAERSADGRPRAGASAAVTGVDAGGDSDRCVCLITGGAGFVGSHLAEALLERGDEVFVLDDLSTGSIDNIAHLKAHPASTTRSTRS